MRKFLTRFRPKLIDPFKEVTFNPRKFDRAMAWAPANIRYVIFFTPRSGSSYLTDIAVRTGVLGNPGECFNRSFIPGIAQSYSARTMREYIDLLVRHRNTGGVFGCEVTYLQMLAVFGSSRRFFEMLEPGPVLSLIRQDIVGQAISASKLVQTRAGHTAGRSDDALAEAEDRFRYDAGAIRRYLERMAWMEQQSEKLFRARGLSPLRLSYEGITSEAPQALLNRIAAHVGAGPVPVQEVASEHRKLPGGKGVEFAERFRKEHPRLLARIDRARQPLLDALDG